MRLLQPQLQPQVELRLTAYYLEAAPNDSVVLEWTDINYLIPDISQNVSDTTDWGIGMGRRNTAIIINHAAGNSYNAPAARACYDYTGGGNTDWFLPSRNELNELYILYLTKGQGSYGDLKSNWYWSSSQHTTATAWRQEFFAGVQSGISKDQKVAYVRPVRAF